MLQSINNDSATTKKMHLNPPTPTNNFFSKLISFNVQFSLKKEIQKEFYLKKNTCYEVSDTHIQSLISETKINQTFEVLLIQYYQFNID